MNEDTDEEVRRLEMQRYPLRRILAFLPGILFFAIVAWLFLHPGYGLLRSEEERWAYSVQSAIAKVQERMPPLPGAVLVYERSSGCLPWKVAGVYAIYATDEPSPQVARQC